YRSVTRAEMRLTERDGAVLDRFFPELWQIAVTVKPTRWGPATAQVWMRGDGGWTVAEELALAYDKSNVAPAVLPPVEMPAAILPAPRARVAAATVAGVAILLFGGAWLGWPRAAPPKAQPAPIVLGLRAVAENREIQVEWNPVFDRAATG